MVQKQTRRKSSLIMGAMLALLLGVAAGFFVLAMPTHMLEAVTTATRLSKLMTQAEPPIMPYDKTVLAVLAGTLTAGIGWVMIDWLLFGRAGMRTLIREREDDYEDSEGDAFRPTDPLDLVAPVTLPTGDWAAPATSDPRRPLSARTDIGDPPVSMPPQGLQPAAMPGIDQLLPPIDQLLPGIGATPPFPAVPPLQQAPQPDPFQSFGAQPQTATMFGGTPTPVAEPPAPPAWSPPAEPPRPEPAPQPASTSRAWLPTPGVRPDGSTPQFDLPPSLSDIDDGDDALDLTPSQAAPDPFAHMPAPIELNTPQPPPLLPTTPPPLEVAPMPVAPAPVAPTFSPAAPPPLSFEPPAPPFAEPTVFDPPAAPPPFAPPPAFEAPPAPFAQPLAFEPPVFEPPAPPFQQPPAFEAPVPPVIQPPQPPVVAAEPVSPRPASTGKIAGIDKDRLEDLLVRLERGLVARKTAAARAAVEPAPAPIPQTPAAPPPQAFATPQPQPFAAPQPPVAAPEPPFVAQQPPFAISQPAAPFAPSAPEAPPSFAPARPAMPPAGFAAPLPSMSQPPMPQTVAPTTAPVYDLPTMPISPAYNLAPIQSAGPAPFAPEPGVEPDEPASDALLDQPLHVTLDLLRNKVRR